MQDRGLPKEALLFLNFLETVVGRIMSDFDDMNVVSTMEETDRKCPQCGGVMDFDPKTGGLHCPYCDYTEAIPVDNSAPTTAQELDFNSVELVENCQWGAEKKTIICKACGAESVYDALEISAVCPFCGSNQVTEANDKKTLAPGGVVPFKLSEMDAGARFKSWIGGKFFCPKAAKETAKGKNFKGVYLPYWTFDADTHSNYTGQYGIDRKVKNSEGQEKTVTDWYNTKGTYDKFYDDELICATTNQNMGMLAGIEPFNTAENVAYKPEYIAGYAAERYAVGIKDAWERAKQSIVNKVRSNIRSKIRSDHHADQSKIDTLDISYNNITYKYLLLPVWIANFKYNGKVYNFMVNGQTGKVSGNTPVSVPKVIITIVAVIVIIALIAHFFT